MKMVPLGSSGLQVPSVALGCMRIMGMDNTALNSYIHSALDLGANFFDHADVYGGGHCEENFGAAWKNDPSIRREDLILQSKTGICRGHYNSSKEYLLTAVDKILTRLQTDYLDVLLIHRPDALVEPEEVAEVFETLKKSGKVLHFGVSNHRTMQIELLKKYVSEPLIVNQLQFGLASAGMVSAGMEANMATPGAQDHDGAMLDYARLNAMTIQTWSPFQKQAWQDGPFIGSEDFPELNQMLGELAEQYKVTPTTIAAAWILRHPAKMQVITGSTKLSRIQEIIAAGEIELTRPEWYKLYTTAGHILP